MFQDQTVRIALLSGGFAIILVWAEFLRDRAAASPRSKLWRNAVYGLLTLAALGSVWSYFQFGRLHEYGPWGRHFYHLHEVYHYYTGAKYYRELGNTRLYDCTAVAFAELRSQGFAVPRISSVRSLRNPMRAHPFEDVVRENKPECQTRFSSDRWYAFKKDIYFFLGLGFIDHWWQVALYDLGFNPPPSWSVLGSPIANAVTLSPWVMEIFPFIDIVLLLIAVPLMIFVVFGFPAACLYLVVFGNNWLASYYWTGGSFFRQIWFFCLTAGFLFLRRDSYRTAGALFGISAALRVFPAAFAIGALLPYLREAWRERRFTPPLRGLVWGGAIALGGIVILSFAFYGLDHWREFFAKISEHNRTHYVMHLGYEKFAVFSPSIGGQNFWWAEGLARFQRWNQGLQAQFDANLAFHWTLRGVLGVLCLLACFRSRPIYSGFLFGEYLLFFFALPANYYYVYLAFFAVALLAQGEERAIPRLSFWLRFSSLGAFLVFLQTVQRLSPDDIVQNGYINTFFFWMMVLFIVSSFVDTSFMRGRKAWEEARRE